MTRTEPQEASSEKRPWHIYFIEDNLLHAISKSRHVYFHVVTKVLRIFKVAPHSEQKDQRMRQVVAYKKLKKTRKSSGPKGGRGRLHFGVLYLRSFMGGSRLREVVAHEGSTVFGELRQDVFVGRIFVVSTPMGVIYTITAMMKWGGRFEMFLSFLK